MTILLCDPRVGAVPLRETGEPLVVLPPALGGVQVRAGLAARLIRAQALLPPDRRLWVVEGYRSAAAQQAVIDRYTVELRLAHPELTEAELPRMLARFVSPLEVAPHVAGAAVDLTMRDGENGDLDLGTEIDATPEQSGGACFFDSPLISPVARANRRMLAAALTAVGLVNYPTEWWHWSYGDQYWALTTGAPHALYGQVDQESQA